MDQSSNEKILPTTTEQSSDATSLGELSEKSLISLAKESLGKKWKDIDIVVDSLVKAFEDGANISEACRVAKIDRQTYYNWLEDSKEFSTLMGDAQEYPDIVAKMNLVRAIKVKRDLETSKWWVERKMKKEFSLRSELTGKDGESLAPILVKFVDGDDSHTS